METKSVPYAFRKEGIYYFSRRIPHDLRSHYSTERIAFSLRTRSTVQAMARANAMAVKLDDFWMHLRLDGVPGHHRLRQQPLSSPERGLKLRDGLHQYLIIKGKGRSATFHRSSVRAVEYLIEARGEKALVDYDKADATAFRDALFERELSSASVVRVFSTVKAIIGFALSENGLDHKNPFQGVYVDRSVGGTDRQSFTPEEIHEIQVQCKRIDDDLRWLIALVSDTGMRLAEAAGLAIDDIVLDGKVPHVTISRHPWRSLKTKASERSVPLVGASLWAARRIESRTTGKFAFPRYASEQSTNSNSASAALNKWLKQVTSGGCVVHSFRHSLRDRLREVECPSDVVDRIGGWTTAGEGQAYGGGYSLDVIFKWMTQITLPPHHF